jgi:hypothetical protein
MTVVVVRELAQDDKSSLSDPMLLEIGRVCIQESGVPGDSEIHTTLSVDDVEIVDSYSTLP